jgi:sec-independent protein translocase protein TatB
MFDIGFSELIVIAVVALIVVGPERLPRVARMAGHLLGRLQRYVGDVKADINREIQLEELRKLEAELRASASSIEQQVHQVGSDLQQLGQSVQQEIAPPVELAELAAASPVEAAPLAELAAAAPAAESTVVVPPPSIPAAETQRVTSS